jgi:hypothetical protein
LLPWDGKTFGRLKVSGPAVSKAYYQVDSKILDEDGFFDTGDVATIDEHGYMRITDRSKDVIKSGGERQRRRRSTINPGLAATAASGRGAGPPEPEGSNYLQTRSAQAALRPIGCLRRRRRDVTRLRGFWKKGTFVTGFAMGLTCCTADVSTAVG